MNLIQLLLESFEPNHNALIKLINDRHVATIYYKGDKENAAGWRTIEPVAYGLGHNGVKYVRAWQRKGKTTTFIPGWKFFRLDRMRNWNIASQEIFDKMRPGYNTQGDKHLSKIFVQARFGTTTTGTKVSSKSKKLVNKLKNIKDKKNKGNNLSEMLLQILIEK